jgi:hypothetical protein
MSYIPRQIDQKLRFLNLTFSELKFFCTFAGTLFEIKTLKIFIAAQTFLHSRPILSITAQSIFAVEPSAWAHNNNNFYRKNLLSCDGKYKPIIEETRKVCVAINSFKTVFSKNVVPMQIFFFTQKNNISEGWVERWSKWNGTYDVLCDCNVY